MGLPHEDATVIQTASPELVRRNALQPVAQQDVRQGCESTVEAAAEQEGLILTSRVLFAIRMRPEP